MRVVSLFAGIGGFDVGFARAGCEIVAHVEKDANCRKLLAARWPDAVALDDVCTAGAHNLPPCDVVTFGFPCQDLSVAGKRAGLAGGRSGLFYEATRIIDELKPAFCLFENVPGLLSSDQGRDFARVLMEMGRIGYCGAWRVLDAQWFGVAQRRRRVFGLFSRLDSGAERCAEILSLEESLRGHPAPSREAGQGVAGCLESRTDGGGFPGTDGACAGHVVPAVAGTLSCNTGPNGHDAGNFASNQGVDAGYLIPAVAPPIRTNVYNNSDPGMEARMLIPAVARTLKARADSSWTQDGLGNDIIPTAAGCLQERDAKGADSDTKPGHLVPVAFQPRYFTRDNKTGGAESCGPVTAALSASRAGGDSAPCAAASMQVRRLTPTECERLQGFPDGYTAGFSDSTRYRMLGNAVCVNVAEWIARRLVNHSARLPSAAAGGNMNGWMRA